MATTVRRGAPTASTEAPKRTPFRTSSRQGQQDVPLPARRSITFARGAQVVGWSDVRVFSPVIWWIGSRKKVLTDGRFGCRYRIYREPKRLLAASVSGM